MEFHFLLHNLLSMKSIDLFGGSPQNQEQPPKEK